MSRYNPRKNDYKKYVKGKVFKDDRDLCEEVSDYDSDSADSEGDDVSQLTSDK